MNFTLKKMQKHLVFMCFFAVVRVCFLVKSGQLFTRKIRGILCVFNAHIATAARVFRTALRFQNRWLICIARAWMRKTAATRLSCLWHSSTPLTHHTASWAPCWLACCAAWMKKAGKKYWASSNPPPKLHPCTRCLAPRTGQTCQRPFCPYSGGAPIHKKNACRKQVTTVTDCKKWPVALLPQGFRLIFQR